LFYGVVLGDEEVESGKESFAFAESDGDDVMHHGGGDVGKSTDGYGVPIRDARCTFFDFEVSHAEGSVDHGCDAVDIVPLRFLEGEGNTADEVEGVDVVFPRDLEVVEAPPFSDGEGDIGEVIALVFPFIFVEK
jgi:hypothetical protein